MRDPLRSLRVVVLATLAAAILFPATAGAGNHTVAGTGKLRGAEARVLKDINRIRVRHGRRPLRLDRPTTHVARARSRDMAAKRYFAHREPDGDDARRILGRRDIPARSVTENIGHTVGLSLERGTRLMARWWYRSAPHRRQMLARGINYVGIGIARRGSRHTYTAIFTRSRDKTEPHVVIDEASVNGDGGRVTIAWRGVDPKLAVGTAGIRRYDLEHLTPFRGWRPFGSDRRGSNLSFERIGSGDPLVRIRAVDGAGNVSPWAYVRIELGDRPRRRL